MGFSCLCKLLGNVFVSDLLVLFISMERGIGSSFKMSYLLLHFVDFCLSQLSWAQLQEILVRKNKSEIHYISAAMNNSDRRCYVLAVFKLDPFPVLDLHDIWSVVSVVVWRSCSTETYFITSFMPECIFHNDWLSSLVLHNGTSKNISGFLHLIMQHGKYHV